MKKLIMLLFSSILVFSLAMPVVAQDTTGQEPAPAKTKTKKAKKAKAPKEKKAKKSKKSKKSEEAPAPTQ